MTKLRDIKYGEKFLFVNGGCLTDIYEKKRKLNEDYCIVGLPKKYDEFAASLDEEVITE